MTPSPRTADHEGAEPVVALRDVRVSYRSRGSSLLRPEHVNALDGISLAVSRHQTVGIVGESGSGKSTAAKVLVGLEQPSDGEVYFAGEVVRRFTGRVRKRLGRLVSVVFQDPATALNARMLVRDTLRDPLDVHKIGTREEREARVQDLISMVGLPTSTLEALPSQLSGGQRQRVAIARALALGPQIIVADEPTSALDVSVRAQILNLLSDLKAELGLGMVFISHDIQTVRYISDEIVVMNSGRIVESGPAAAVLDRPADPYTRTLLGAAPSLLAPKIPTTNAERTENR
jgi:peptide/nickel transport system ATP-binding protein